MDHYVLTPFVSFKTKHKSASHRILIPDFSFSTLKYFDYLVLDLFRLISNPVAWNFISSLTLSLQLTIKPS